ncbi:MFS transporter (Seo1) [Didymella glomerata]|uniref:MFS transporter (Seo1) n=1 Tax=Didymella glomerata TaxID=749621 RepID=A0A9W8WS75_9PLEO|nr:MFS transporter (Seo1) [Didymella glomerata]
MSEPSNGRKWYQIRWFQDYDTPEERKLIAKLDFLIVPYVFLAYWVKYIDQANINNAYVAGLKEDLRFHGNELVRLQTMYIIGAVVGQLPFMYLFTRIPMFYLVPFLDVAWGIFTLLQYRVHSFAELAAYRFLVGLFEAAFFPAIHYIFGSWYRGDEIGRRGGFFYVGLTLGTLTAALIQSGATSRLDGVHGLAGWRWMYIICAIITIPVGLLGLCVLPGTPDKPNMLVLTERDVTVARNRLARAGHNVGGSVTLGTFVKIARSPLVWAFLLLDIFFWNGSINTSSGGYLLWLKSLDRYSKARINELGAISPALGIFYTLTSWNITGLIILTIWNVPEPAIWFAFMTTYSAVAMSTERAVALVLANTLAQSTTAWTPLLVFKTVEGPRFPKGWPFVLANAVCLIILAHIIRLYIKKRPNEREPISEDESAASIQETVEISKPRVLPVHEGPA